MTKDSWLREDGMSIYEIAELLGVTPRAVQKVEANALAKLRRHPRVLREFLGINDHLGAGFDLFSTNGPKEGSHR